MESSFPEKHPGPRQEDQSLVLGQAHDEAALVGEGDVGDVLSATL